MTLYCVCTTPSSKMSILCTAPLFPHRVEWKMCELRWHWTWFVIWDDVDNWILCDYSALWAALAAFRVSALRTSEMFRRKTVVDSWELPFDAMILMLTHSTFWIIHSVLLQNPRLPWFAYSKWIDTIRSYKYILVFARSRIPPEPSKKHACQWLDFFVFCCTCSSHSRTKNTNKTRAFKNTYWIVVQRAATDTGFRSIANLVHSRVHVSK